MLSIRPCLLRMARLLMLSLPVVLAIGASSHADLLLF